MGVISMEKLIMSNQPLDNQPSRTVAAATEAELNLLEVMEIFSWLCVTDPILLLQILDDCAADVSAISRESSMAEFMWLKLSPFGRRLKQIY